MIQVADKYGIIVAGDAEMPSERLLADAEDSTDVLARGQLSKLVVSFDQLMKELLQTFAVDPDKIALLGGSATGQGTTMYAKQNMDVFSRVLVHTQHWNVYPKKLPAQTNEFYISGGLLEHAATLEGVRQMRDSGYTVKYTLQFRPHGAQYEDYDFMGHWLRESWTTPDPAARPAPYALGDPPPLTVEVMAKMTAFWRRFMQEPDSIRTTARRAYVREVVLPVGKERVSTLMVDMPALAAQYPSVAAVFREAGLTPQQHDIDRAALVSARIAWIRTHRLVYRENDVLGFGPATVEKVDPPTFIEPGSVLAQNLAYIEAHTDEYEALLATKMWSTP